MEKRNQSRGKFSVDTKKSLNNSMASCSSTSSTATIVQKKFVPDFVNNNNLRKHLHRSFDTRGEKQLQQIMIFNKTLNSGQNSSKKKSFSCSSKNPNDLIIQEFLSISDKQVWSSVLSNFKTNPQGLFNLITPNSKRRPNKKSSKIDKDLWNNQKIFKTLEPLNSEEDDVVTFKSSDSVPEDWSKSLLFWKVKKHVHKNTLHIEDIQKFLTTMPRTHEGLARGIEKGLGIIENYLLEMIGTSEDMKNFKGNYSLASLTVYEALYEKCLAFAKMRRKAVKIMKLIITREAMIEALKTKQIGRKAVIVKICLVSSNLKPLLSDWVDDPTIPFCTFVFKGENYCKKMQKDTLTLQKYLS